jgi:hypothetical protein
VNGRNVASEVATLAAGALWVYGGTSLAVAAYGDDASVSIGAAAAVVGLSYGLGRLLQRLHITEPATRFWGAGLSIGLLYLILRIDIVGEPYLWEMGWFADLLSEPGRTLEGHASDVTEVVLLGGAWVRGVVRGAGDLTFDGVLAEVSLGLVVVLLAAAFAPAAGAPGAVHWLPVPYMVASLLALALARLGSVEADRRRPFLRVWTLWTGGSVGVMGGLALLAAFFDPPSLETVSHSLMLAARGVALAVTYLMSPFIFSAAWVMEHLIDWIGGGEGVAPEPRDTGQLMGLPEGLQEAEETEPARWSRVLGYVLRSGLVVLAIAVALAVLWFAFRRFPRRREDGTEIREEVAFGEAGPLGDLRSIFSGALGRLRGRAGGETRGQDAVGRLYFSVLRRAAEQGVPRSPAVTPLEFAPRLEEHFNSAIPGAISRAFAEARYGCRPCPQEEVEYLRSHWEVEARYGA